MGCFVHIPERYSPSILFLIGWLLCYAPAQLIAQNQLSYLKASYLRATEKDKIPLLHSLVEAYIDKNIDSARFYAEEAFKLRERTNQISEKVRCFLMMGNTLMRTKTPTKEVRQYFEIALSMAEKAHDNALSGEVFIRFGKFYTYKGNAEEGVLMFQKAIEHYRLTPDVHGLQAAYHDIGTAYTQQGKPQKALEALKKALALFKEQKRDDETGILSEIGNVYFSQGDFIEALNYYKQAYATAVRFNNAHAQGFCLNNIGLVHNNLGNYDDALEYHLKALKMREIAQTQDGISNSYNNIGRTYLLLGYNERGKLYIQKALEIDKKAGNKMATAQDLDNIGMAFLNDQKYVEALESFEEALKIRQEMGQSLPIGISLDNIGKMYARQRKYEAAIQYFTKADSIFIRAQAQDFMTNIQIRLARAFFEMGKIDESEQASQKALKSALARHTKTEIMEASQILAQVFSRKGKHAEAYTLQTQALAYKDSLHNEERNKRALRMQALFEFKQQEKENQQLKDDKNDIIRLQYITVAVFTLLVLVLGIFVYFLWTSKRLHEHKKIELAVKNEEITRQASEIDTQKTAIELQNKELQSAHKELSEANQELVDSIAYAHRIQKAVLPTHEEIGLILPAHFILYKPRNVVSGDFYWFSDKENHTVMAVMDCTGHGIPGAFMSLIGNDILHEIVNLREILDPAQILTELKIRVNTVLKQHATKGRDGMDIGVCVIDHPKEDSDLPRYLYFEAAHLSLWYFQDREPQEIAGSKIYIGGYDPDDTERFFTTKTLCLDKPTVCYLFSDGFQDQFAENSKKKFTKKRLRNVLFDIHLLSPQIQGEILEETFDEWKGKGEQTDDVIVFGVAL